MAPGGPLEGPEGPWTSPGGQIWAQIPAVSPPGWTASISMQVLWPLKRPLRPSRGPQKGPFWPQEALWGPPKGSPGAKIGPFLLPDGSIWTDTVVYDQGKPLRRSGHPTCLYSGKNSGTPHGATKLKGLDQMGPFVPLAAKKGPTSGQGVW